jgi:hypothetical protein
MTIHIHLFGDNTYAFIGFEQKFLKHPRYFFFKDENYMSGRPSNRTSVVDPTTLGVGSNHL